MIRRKLFSPTAQHHDVLNIHIYLLRVLYLLMCLVVGKEAWGFLFSTSTSFSNATNSASPVEAVAWSVWAAFSLFALWGVFAPLKVLPIILFEIVYKCIWLIFIAYPLTRSGEQLSTETQELIQAFLWVLLPIIAVPWKYVYRSLIKTNASVAQAS